MGAVLVLFNKLSGQALVPDAFGEQVIHHAMDWVTFAVLLGVAFGVGRVLQKVKATCDICEDHEKRLRHLEVHRGDSARDFPQSS